MTHSMTAFARVHNQLGAHSFCWEVKSVNHRYLDVCFRLQDAYRSLELNLRNLLRGQVSRGKLECLLKIDEAAGEYQSMQLNTHLVQALLNTSERLAAQYQLADDFTVSRILAWPGVIEVSPVDVNALSGHIEQSFQAVLSQLVEARLTEGMMLKDHIQARVQLMKDEITQAESAVISMASETRSKLLARLQTIKVEVPEARVEQEIALILSRLDVNEELDRLKTHLHEVARTLECDDVAGRRLDFLMQELNREANTLGSKSDSVALTQHAVQMKVLIEQMREQIQNIE